MEIKLDLDKSKLIKFEKMKPCGLYKCSKKNNGRIILIIKGYAESHFIDKDGFVTYASKNNNYIEENYNILEKVVLKF
jgi:hypothetical protein